MKNKSINQKGEKMKLKKILEKHLKNSEIKEIKISRDNMVATNGYWLLVDSTMKVETEKPYFLNLYTGEIKTNCQYPKYEEIIYNETSIGEICVDELIGLASIIKLASDIILKIENEKVYISGFQVLENGLDFEFNSKIKLGYIEKNINLNFEFTIGYQTYSCLVDILKYYKINYIEFSIKKTDIKHIKSNEFFVLKLYNKLFDFYFTSRIIKQRRKNE